MVLGGTLPLSKASCARLGGENRDDLALLVPQDNEAPVQFFSQRLRLQVRSSTRLLDKYFQGERDPLTLRRLAG
jgi:hypothetical protein